MIYVKKNPFPRGRKGIKLRLNWGRDIPEGNQTFLIRAHTSSMIYVKKNPFPRGRKGIKLRLNWGRDIPEGNHVVKKNEKKVPVLI